MPRRSDPHPLALAIGARVRTLRQERSLTAERLAYQSEVSSKGYLSDIEHGLALPSLETLQALAQVLEVDLVDLLTSPEENPRHALIERTRNADAPLLRRWMSSLEQPGGVSPTAPKGPWHPGPSTLLPAYPQIEVAAGRRRRSRAAPSDPGGWVRLPGVVDPVECFAVRASGQSMEGWRREIQAGDWLVFRWSRVGLAAATGRVALVAHRDRTGDLALQVKRILLRRGRLVLASDSPRYAAHPVTERHELLGLLVASHAPATLAPLPATTLSGQSIGAAFGLAEDPSPGWCRVEGHLFALLVGEEAARLSLALAPLASGTASRRRRRILQAPFALAPAESAFVIVAEQGAHRYLGVAAGTGTRQLALTV